MRKYHHAIATARGIAAEAEDLGPRITTGHHGTGIARDMKEEADNPDR
jgi:hypothetical protein